MKLLNCDLICFNDLRRGIVLSAQLSELDFLIERNRENSTKKKNIHAHTYARTSAHFRKLGAP